MFLFIFHKNYHRTWYNNILWAIVYMNYHAVFLLPSISSSPSTVIFFIITCITAIIVIKEQQIEKTTYFQILRWISIKTSSWFTSAKLICFTSGAMIYACLPISQSLVFVYCRGMRWKCDFEVKRIITISKIKDILVKFDYFIRYHYQF